MTSAQFRRWLWYLIDDPSQCKTHGLSAVPTSIPPGGPGLFENPIYTYFHEGRRSVGVGLEVLAQRIAPKFYLYMLNEAMGLRNQQVSPPVQVPPPPSRV